MVDIRHQIVTVELGGCERSTQTTWIAVRYTALLHHHRNGGIERIGSGAADMTVGFDVMAPAATISSAQLTQVGATSNGGVASIGELICLGGPIIGCPSQDTARSARNYVEWCSSGATSISAPFGI
jgi:hypothetical protein